MKPWCRFTSTICLDLLWGSALSCTRTFYYHTLLWFSRASLRNNAHSLLLILLYKRSKKLSFKEKMNEWRNNIIKSCEFDCIVPLYYRNFYRNALILDLSNSTTVFSSPAGVWCLELNDVDLLVMIRTWENTPCGWLGLDVAGQVVQRQELVINLTGLGEDGVWNKYEKCLGQGLIETWRTQKSLTDKIINQHLVTVL